MQPLPFIVSVCYALFLLLLWVPITSKKPAHLLLSAAAVLHLSLAVFTLFQDKQLHLDFITSLSALAALTMCGRLLFIGLNFPRSIDTCLAACALILSTIQTYKSPTLAFNHLNGLAFNLHVAIAIAAYVLLTLAAVLAATLWIAEKRLHQKPSSRFAQSLPPLLSLEKQLFYLLWVGFGALSITLISGAVFSEELFGRPLVLSHKVIFSSIAWLVFATLLIGRIRHGWRGKLAIKWTLTGFGFLVLAYAGSKFVLEILLHRTPF